MKLSFPIFEELDENNKELGRLLFSKEISFVKGVVDMAPEKTCSHGARTKDTGTMPELYYGPCVITTRGLFLRVPHETVP